MIRTIGFGFSPEIESRGLLLVSVISIWELGLLNSKGRVHLRLPCQQWVEDALASPGLSLAPLTPEIALNSSRLTGTLMAIPPTASIVATDGRQSVTRDQKLLAHAEQGYVYAI